MITSQIQYEGNLRTLATHLSSSSTIITDAPTDNEGKGEAFSPTDLVATALGSCMLTIIGIKAKDNEMDVSNMKMDVCKIMEANPRKISEIVIDFHFPNTSYSEKEKIIIENSARTCPVALSLDSAIKQTLTFNF